MSSVRGGYHRKKPVKVALVLAGGAARGAYEVGVVQHLLEKVPRDIGREVRLDILSGTSVGALNVCVLAGLAHEPELRAMRLARAWTDLKIEDVVRPARGEVLRLAKSFLSRSAALLDAPRGGILDPSGLEDVIRKTISFPNIEANLRAGLFSALTVSTTHVATGRTVVFVHSHLKEAERWSRDPTIVPRRVSISYEHALASASIPLLFPAVRIEREYYCDGGLRQNVPLSPARRLGADALIVVNPRHVATLSELPETTGTDEARPGSLLLLGKTLNALLLDRIDNDIDRLSRINAILDAGTRRFGPTFVDELNQELGLEPARGLRPLRSVLIRASRDIGRFSSDFAKSRSFRARVSGVLAKVVQRFAESQTGEADLLSYVLFDGQFASELIELGRKDAEARHDDLCALLDPK